MTLYDDLGVPPDATVDEINAAYRRAAKQHHPDTGGDREAFARIQLAAEVLRDPDRRARYDETGAIDDAPRAEQAEAAAVLCDVFRQVRQQFRANFAWIDLISQMKAGLDQALDGVRQERERVKVEQKVTAETIRRLRHRGEGTNFIRLMLEEEAAKHASALVSLDRRQRIVTEALALADHYDWTVDDDDALDAVRLPGSPRTSVGLPPR